ncbi:hypothetical protein LZ30DRAFT_739716 [Colletotrichum cereale]|nr:hypothetical protein LZ30DRAFT_739716 [Colletotrichum cereale]
MKSKRSALPGLQAAAALYLARTSEAKVFCAGADRAVVPDESCKGAQTPGQFFVFDKNVTDIALGTQVEPEIGIYDASDVVLRQNAKYPPPSNAPAPQTARSLVARGWDCDKDAIAVGVIVGATGAVIGGAVIIGYFGRGPGSIGGVGGAGIGNGGGSSGG